MEDIEEIYLGHENKIDKILTNDEVAVDLETVTRVTVDFRGTTVDSDVVGYGEDEPFDWTVGGGQLTMFFGKLEESPGVYLLSPGMYRAEVIVYAPDNPDGIVWGTFPVRVINLPYTPV